MTYSVAVDAYRSSQLPELLRLFGTYFSAGDRLLSADYSDWLYGRNPFGRAWMVSVSHGGLWVAFVALIPVAFERAGDRMPAYYAVNALVDPRHQGHSLFARMISAGRDHIAAEGFALLGHPNAQAMKTWKRAGVDFQEVLRPALAIPKLRSRGWSARETRDGRDLDALDDILAAQAAVRDHWKVHVSGDFLRWRFLDQPGNQYRVQILEHDGRSAGIQITRRMRRGIHLLVDQFLRDEHLAPAVSLLPPITVCFVPESGQSAFKPAAFRLPVRKTLPYFFTTAPAVSAASVRHVGLTASDF